VRSSRDIRCRRRLSLQRGALSLALLASACCAPSGVAFSGRTNVGTTAPDPIRPAGNCEPKSSDELAVPLIGQQSSLLCWAGVTEMIARWFELEAPQCDQVLRLSNTCDPCLDCEDSTGAPYGPCNFNRWPDFQGAGLEATEGEFGFALPLDDLKKEISCHRRPVAFAWQTAGTGHIMVAYGYQGENIMVADPRPMCHGALSVISYSQYVKGPAPHLGSSHWRDYWGIQPRAEHP
jgi:hypothetical protein